MKALDVLLNGNSKMTKTRALAYGWGQPRKNAPTVPMPELMHTFVKVCIKVVIEFLDGPKSDWCALTRVFTILKEQSDASRQTLSIAVYLMCAHEKLKKDVRSRLTALLAASETPMHVNRPPKDSKELAHAENLVLLRLQDARGTQEIEAMFGQETQTGMNTTNPHDWVHQIEIVFPPADFGDSGFATRLMGEQPAQAPAAGPPGGLVFETELTNPNDWDDSDDLTRRSLSPGRGESPSRKRSRSGDPPSPAQGRALLQFLPAPLGERSLSMIALMKLCQKVADQEVADQETTQ